MDRSSDVPWNWGEARARCVREARRVLRSPAQVEDAVQEALLRAWVKRASCRSPDQPLPWVAQIARNEALRIRAREAGRPEIELEEWELEQRMAQAEPTQPLLRRLDVDRALADLEPDDRRLLELRYFGDLTQPRTAELLGIPEGTVKVRLHRLRSRLRKRLEGHE